MRRPALTISGGIALVSGNAGNCIAGAWSAAANAAAASAKASAPAARAMFETGIVITPAISARPANESYVVNEPRDAQGCCRSNTFARPIRVVAADVNLRAGDQFLSGGVMNAKRAAAAGAIGTGTLTALWLVEPSIGLPKIAIGQILSTFMSVSVAHLRVGAAGGWVVHLLVGILLALIYARFFAERLPGPPAARGAMYG